jgi:hypothetical protein
MLPIIWVVSSFQKITMSLQKQPNWPNVTRPGHPGSALMTHFSTLGQCYNFFRNLPMGQLSKSVPGKPFKHNLIFANKSICVTPIGKAPGLTSQY